VHAIRLLIDTPPVRPKDGVVPDGDSLSPVAPHRVDFIAAIEAATGKVAQRNLMPMQAGDVPARWANADLLKSLTGYTPKTAVPEGVANFVEWYRDYYQG
jgi:UDP-glucuronate 4-epimerase